MDDESLDMYKSLFKGREDVFAVRWEKNNKSSYMPAFNFDPHRYKLHQMKGGTFADFPDKTYQPLTNAQLIKHFNGEQVVGLYLEVKTREIDKLLGVIRTQVRQQYLETNPENFTRIVHDYSDDQKGFVIWKDLLEEKLF